ncbi:condensation domain-containing protein [Streptomyces anulatus]|uniref:condensation domain-containing protein n=1 Tax=Streptomyces anulatus TaxID=1892 RepID=UPI002257BE9B|nr:condensation domain-containing protein [Streptomyces anulatus]MCX4521959.1 condensation domain-containing protein [Streptomyces anulatus]MCX4604835.1 condensation domain-containing protein [Streptomyces anulatus]WTE29658.1 condensation domain-containing protein [Streptomyces anulatus]
MTEAHPAQASGLHAEAVTTAERCRRIWGDLLHVPEIEDQDDFFVLGGHSMLATRAMTRLRKELGGVELSASIIFEHPVFHEFVAGVDTALGRTARDASPGIGRTSGPVSLQQEELLRLDAALGPSPANNVVVLLEIHDRLDIAVLRRALHRLLNRHPALRTAFRPLDSGFEQTVAPPWPESGVELVAHDVPGEHGAATRRIRALLREKHLRPFDLTAGNLLRAQLFRRPDGPDLLACHLHHAAFDGTSGRVLAGELAEACGGRRDAAPPPGGTEPDAPGAEPTYVDYAVRQRETLDGLLAQGRRHWLRTVGDLAADMLEMPRADDRPSRHVRAAARVEGEVLRQIREWARADGATDFVVLAGAVAAALGRLTHRSCLGIGTLLDNRDHSGLERAVGAFANSTLLAVPVPSHTTPGKIATEVRERLTEARRWADAPLGVLLEEPCGALCVRPTELVDAVFWFDGPPAAKEERATVRLADLREVDARLVDLPFGPGLGISVSVGRADEVHVSVEYAAPEHGPTAQDVVDRIVTMLRFFSTAPDGAIPAPEDRPAVVL